MNSYNGFTPAQRSKAGAWIRAQVKKGLAHRPKKCCACGQEEGQLDNHQEDYSEPFGDHLFRFPMCYCCHMMLHCRYRNPTAWSTYRQCVAAGMRVQPPFMTRSWDRIRSMLQDPARHMKTVRDGGGTIPGVLDEIDAGLHDPRKMHGSQVGLMVGDIPITSYHDGRTPAKPQADLFDDGPRRLAYPEPPEHKQ